MIEATFFGAFICLERVISYAPDLHAEGEHRQKASFQIDFAQSRCAVTCRKRLLAIDFGLCLELLSRRCLQDLDGWCAAESSLVYPYHDLFHFLALREFRVRLVQLDSYISVSVSFY